jgi:hypothetical protein
MADLDADPLSIHRGPMKMKTSRILFAALLLAAAVSACSEPTAPALPGDPIPAPQPSVAPSFDDFPTPPKPAPVP